ncbi:Ankyrin repeats (3 copies) [Legionella massiliensis]|uniref:Ankyrin repeats (3 copies) n=1 Tax=Legionella massiliensis TaxID=1034943 RepID=A0A078KYP8_9GAMM|nr:ankyrin repeat domain-containing protein [Legionella massiliensis]CDZ78046.1 Ankyrin repeats (3 copies) [Legionella massiliensis]CEE13784.1 Ankyrin repeats (3 copies) [Legionella massiliensis]
MLETLINCIKNGETITHLDNILLNLPTIQRALTDARVEERKLLATVRIARYTKASSTEVLEAFEKQSRLVRFLEFCEGALKTEKQENSAYMLVFEYWLTLPLDQRPDNHALKVNGLFMALLAENAKSCMEYYANNKNLFLGYPQTRTVAEHNLKLTKGLAQVNESLLLLQQLLAEQENPLGIQPLFKSSISETEKLAAFLLWLIERNTSVETILQTQLLHDFLRYNMSYLDSEDSDIHYLYQLLSHFPQTAPLIEQAKITSCDERGFERYALDGELKEEGSVQSIDPEERTLDFSPTANNFDALYQLFGSAFLHQALNWLAVNEDEHWSNLLEEHLNSPACLTTELPALINYIAKENPQMLELLASLIRIESLDLLLSSQNGAVMHLLPYNPELLDSIDAPSIASFIQEIRANVASYDLIAQLSALFDASLQRHHETSPLIFDAIIDSLYENSHLVDDDELIALLEKYPYRSQNLKQRCQNLQQLLEDTIAANTSDATFATHNYHLIEDMWQDTSMKLRVLNGIKPSLEVEPYDKYSLYVRIVQSSINQHGQVFDLDAFIQALELPDRKAPVGASLHERVYVELLCAIDDQILRVQLADLLGNSDWMAKDYGGLSVLIKAAQQGNTGLIQLLVENYNLDLIDLEPALSASTTAGHWETANYLCSLPEAQLEKEQLLDLLRLAVDEGQLTTIKLLVEMDSFTHVNAKVFNQLLESAATKGHLEIVKFLCEHPSYTLKTYVMNKLFQIALKSNHLEILAYFCNSPCPPMQTQVDKAFELAATSNNLELTKFFCSSENIPPSKGALERVFKLVSALGFPLIVQYLRESHPSCLTQPVCADAMVDAAANGRLGIVNYLMEFTLASAAGRVLKAAIKNHRWGTANYICNVSAGAPHLSQVINAQLLSMAKEGNSSDVKKLLLLKIKPQPHAIENAQLEAIKQGHFSLAVYLFNTHPPSTKFLNKALIEAVNSKSLAMVSYLCELENMPDLRIMKAARRRCLSKSQTEIAAYLFDRIKELPTQNEQEDDTEQPPATQKIAPNLSAYGVFSRSKIKRAATPLSEVNLSSSTGVNF